MTRSESRVVETGDNDTGRRSRRRGWLPTRRAIFAAMFLMVPWGMIVVPAMTWPPAMGFQSRIFGWPFVHCNSVEANSQARQDEITRLQQLSEKYSEFASELPGRWSSDYQHNGSATDYPFWSNADHWRYWGADTIDIRWHWIPLMKNIAIGLLIYLALLILLEWRIRRLGRLFRIRLQDIFVAAVFMAIPLAILGNTLAGSARDDQLLAKLHELGATETGTFKTVNIPVWLDRLLDNRASSLVKYLVADRSLSRVTRIDLSQMKWDRQIDNVQFDRIAKTISSFESLVQVHATFGSNWNAELLEHIRPERIQQLDVEASFLNVSKSGIASLAHCTKVKVLSVHSLADWSSFSGGAAQPTGNPANALLEAIKPMTALRELNLHWFTIREKDCAAILNFPSLKWIFCLSITPGARQMLLEGNPRLKIICNPD